MIQWEEGPVDNPERSAAAPLGDALTSMTTALQLLDSADAPADIAAHLDLAVHRLQEVMGISEKIPGNSSDA